jgi:putative intracellular protease/amidase
MTARRLLAVALIAGVGIALAPYAVAQQSEAPKVQKLTLGVLLYPDFEPLDVFGPVEMFMNVPKEMLEIFYVAEQAGPVTGGSGGGQKGPRVYADYGYADAPKIDILLVPGGFGTLPQLANPKTLDFIRARTEASQLTTSVCSGSALLAKAGVLDGKQATCNKVYFDMLTPNGPDTTWVRRARWVEDGKMITSSGVSAGMDMALAVIAKLWGEETAESIAAGTEYVWSRDPHNDPFAIETTD